MINKKLSTQEFIDRAIKVHIGKYDYSSVIYSGAHNKIVILCQNHGPFSQTARSHLNGSGCLLCYRDSQKLSLNKFVANARVIHGDVYDYSNFMYTNNYTKSEIICTEHGSFSQTPAVHLRGNGKGSGCTECYRDRQRNNIDDLKERMSEIHKNLYDYSLITRYENNKEKIQIICNKHGLFNQEANSHLRGIGCPKCHLSKGEARIEQFLISRDINYASQFSFSNLRFKNKLYFDFYIPDFNMLIEFNGEQHFRQVHRFHKSGTAFRSQLNRDLLKEKFASENNIKLVVIPYWDYNNIETILNRALTKTLHNYTRVPNSI